MATTKQRRRQLAREKYERRQARRSAGRHQRRTVLMIAGSFVVVIALVFALGRVLSGDDDDVVVAPDEGAADETMTGECVYTATGDDVDLPPAVPETADTASISLDGNTVTIELAAGAAPCTVGSLVHLAGQGYFDGTECHRLTTSATLSVLQCGDPTGTGGGGPGYNFGLENVDGAVYEAGTVAMARRAGEPDSNGSQFFLVYGDSQLPPEYTVFGHISDGLEVITDIAQRGTADGSSDGAPAEAVTITSVVTS